ncbi:TIR domain-containing protein [Ideonella sp. 4Y11]|uniref:TIR domain-containing protein n=1 Tax=Ideonella aquatica TaxID=2824119 RepID=A0A940YJ98_9BURK|nr:TIR domain-containing protein [Ideonella aquatica]MBQ0960534.1 TIR domain-containing protein [Ideonella aquatica]
MKIFISWSGEKSRQIGEAFRNWLPEVIQSVRPYFTPDDVAKGQRWATEIAENLHNSQFGLFCLTAENLTAPWLLFEAGAVSKDSRNGKVCPLLFGVDSAQLAGPLLQFQATPYSRDEVFKFMKVVNAETATPLTEVQLERAFDRCWNELDDNIQSILSSKSPDLTPAPRSLQDMVEETLSIVRSISFNPAPPVDDGSVNHWLVLLQNAIDYGYNTLRVTEKAEQAVVLDQLNCLQAYLRLTANLITPKIKPAKTFPKYSAQMTKLMASLDERIKSLTIALDIPF